MPIHSPACALQAIQSGSPLSGKDQIRLILQLSWPAILAQVSVTIMQLIDTAMTGRLGAGPAASIGLVSSTTWLINGICSGVVYGFSVPCAQAIGAKKTKEAASLCRQGICACLLAGGLAALAGVLICGRVPVWLGGEAAIQADASAYLGIFCLSMPFFLLNSCCVQMLQAAGNTRLPGMVQVVMCFLDVTFNGLFIFVLNLGVAGAAIGSAASEVCASLFLLHHLLRREPMFEQKKAGKRIFHPGFTAYSVKKAFFIGLPVSAEQLVTGSSYVVFTRIVSALGSISIAANSFAITAESLCYMPAFGCAAAATAIIGQCVGAARQDLAREIAGRICLIGILMMSLSGIIMFALSPALMRLLTPDVEIAALGARILRLEAFAEPMYGASIVTAGILRGKGDTLWPALLNLLSIWGVRIPLAALLAKSTGLFGAWIAMNIELNLRGVLFLLRLKKAFGSPKRAPNES